MADNHKVFLSKWVTPVFSTPDNFSHWFGYYNYSPLDREGRRLLAHRTDFDGRAIESGDVAEIGWFDLEDGSWHGLGKTGAFNWQQGAMLQWLGPDFASRVIFNDVEDGHFVARVVGLDGCELKRIPWPVYGVTPDGKTSVSIQFERSYWCRAYHYESVQNGAWNVPLPQEDGVFKVDLETGSVDRIIAIQDIVRHEENQEFDSSSHWLEHVMLNPSGTRFAVYHRFGQGNFFKTRVFTSNLAGQELYLCPGWQEEAASHLGWQNDQDFVLFAGKAKGTLVGQTYARMAKQAVLGTLAVRIYRRFLKRFVPRRICRAITSNAGYVRYRDKQGVIGEYSKGMLSIDGHPSFTPDGKFMLTDTYADNDGYRHLLLFDIAKERVLTLARFYSPFNSCGHRCDLHPRFSRDQTSVIIDTAHSGQHQMMVIRLDWSAILKV